MPRIAAGLGFAFGFGLFGAGVSWVYIALNTFGGMSLPWRRSHRGLLRLSRPLPRRRGLALRPLDGTALVAARDRRCGAWTAMEWLRSLLFSGFGWLSLGYSQLPASPFAGYAPVGGVFAVTLAVALVRGRPGAGHRRVRARRVRTRHRVARGDRRARRSAEPRSTSSSGRSPAGAPIAVSLVQGNVTQDEKFDPDFRPQTFDLYADLVARSRGRLVVLPESAFPAFAAEIPEPVLLDLLQKVAKRDGDIMVGLFTLEPPLPGSDQPQYFNSVVTLGAAESQLYRKRHLVPFGETIPLEPVVGWFMRSVLVDSAGQSILG